MFGKVAAVIVTYNIDQNIIKTVKTIIKQVDKVFIVDNNSCFHTLKYLNFIEKCFNNVIIIYNNENIGLAKAQNIGIKQALKENFQWILLLDHDSFLKTNFIDCFKKYYSSLSFYQQQRVAILAPRVYDLNLKKFYSYLVKNGFLFKRVKCCEHKSINNVLFAISSGSLIKRDCFLSFGFLREDFFIDFVDVEYCLRVITKGYEIHVVCDSVLLHRLGERKIYKILGISFNPTFHTPDRRFYIYRNRKRVWKIYFKYVPSFVLYDVLASCFDILRIILFEDFKLKKLSMCFKGFITK